MDHFGVEGGSECQAFTGLLEMVRKVRSGDPDNKEAQASKLYWKYYMGEVAFRRGRDGPPPNNMLNYGYAVVRAAVARALVSAGLHRTAAGLVRCYSGEQKRLELPGKLIKAKRQLNPWRTR